MKVNNEIKKHVNGFIRLLCDDLSIKKPDIVYKNNIFNSKTQLAAYAPDEKRIYIKNEYENLLDLFFAISHELRHKYQIDYKIYDFSTYKNAKQISNYDYNMQEVEIDANAYAYIIMNEVFNVNPLFNGLDIDIIQKIKQRAELIVNEKAQ